MSDRAPHRPVSLWKRAALHGLKRLMRKHPGAALDAAGASLVYAGREAIHEGADFVKEKIAEVTENLSPDVSCSKTRGRQHRPLRRLSGKERKVLLQKLGSKERRDLAKLATRTEK